MAVGNASPRPLLFRQGGVDVGTPRAVDFIQTLGIKRVLEIVGEVVRVAAMPADTINVGDEDLFGAVTTSTFATFGGESKVDIAALDFIDDGMKATVRDGGAAGGGNTAIIGWQKGPTPPTGCTVVIDAQGQVTTSAAVAATLWRNAYNAIVGVIPTWRGTARLDLTRTGSAYGSTDRVYMETTGTFEAAQTHNNGNGAAFVLSSIRKAACIGGDNLSVRLNAAIALAAAIGGAVIEVPGIRQDVGHEGEQAIYRMTTLWDMSLGDHPMRDVAVTVDFKHAWVIHDCDGLAGLIRIGGDYNVLHLQNVTIRGRSHWSEDGPFAIQIQGFSNLAAYTVENVRIIGWTDSPGTAATSGAPVWVEGEATLRNVLPLGCGGTKGVVASHNIHRLFYENVTCYDSGVLGGENFEKNVRPLGWFVFGNASAGTGSGTDSGVVYLNGCRADENYAADKTTHVGMFNFDPSLPPPQSSFAYDPTATLRALTAIDCVGRQCINAGGWGVGMLLKRVEHAVISGLQIYRDAGLSQHTLAIQECGSVVVHGVHGDPNPLGDRVTFIGTLNGSYEEYSEADAHAGWFLAAETSAGVPIASTLPPHTKVVRDGVEARLVQFAASVSSAPCLATESSTTANRYAATTFSDQGGLGRVVQTPHGVLLDTGAAAGVGRLVDKSGEQVRLPKDTLDTVRGAGVAASPDTLGRARNALNGTCARWRETSSAAAGTLVAAVWLGTPRDRPHYRVIVGTGNVSPGYVGKTATDDSGYLIPAGADADGPEVVVMNAVVENGNSYAEIGRSGNEVDVAYDAGVVEAGQIVSSAGSGTAHANDAATPRKALARARRPRAGGTPGLSPAVLL